MMRVTYFWDGEKLISVPEQVWLENCKPYLNMPCVDTYRETDSGERYGMFRPDPKATRGCYWGGRRLDDFPKEFRASLLLLGVT